MGQNKVAMKRTVSSDRPFTLYCYKGCKSDGSSRFDTISILIPSDTIFADTSKNYTILFDSIQEYIDRYIDIIILYTYFKQPSTFLLTHNCNQNTVLSINEYTPFEK